MSCCLSILLIRNLHDVFGENDPARRRAAIVTRTTNQKVSVPTLALHQSYIAAMDSVGFNSSCYTPRAPASAVGKKPFGPKLASFIASLTSVIENIPVMGMLPTVGMADQCQARVATL